MSEIKWQDFLNILTLKGKDTGDLDTVSGAEEDIKFKICYTANKSYLEEWLAERTKTETKSASKSTELRLAGNAVYQKGKDVEALKFYNLSVSSAPFNTNPFALALANRSAVLGRLNYQKEAIQDIDLALKHGDSEVPRTKLLIRKALFLHKLCLFKEALHLIKSIFPNEEQIGQENDELKKAYFNALMETENGTEAQTSTTEHSLPMPKGGNNKSFLSASAHVVLNFSKEKGRHVIAQEDLEMSDVIFVEKPFAVVVLPDQYQHHCHQCCKKIVAYFPCQECTRALFCSEVCQEVAWTQYHQWECRGLGICHSIGIAHLGLRVALLADSSEIYKQVLALETHIDDMTSEDLYQYTITAVLLTLYLKHYTSYFERNTSLDVEEMGCRILRHIAQLICNGHAITKIDSTLLEKGSRKTMKEAQVRIGTAIYPSASMMNHSCDQNISNSFINEYLIVRAVRPIKKGEEVFNCYGPHYKTTSRAERQTVLQSQYFFTCDCCRCRETTDSELEQFSALLCSYCSGPVMKNRSVCAHCSRPQLLVDLVNLALTAQQAFHQGQKLMNEGNIKDALTCLEESVNLSSKCLYKHNADLRTYKDSLAQVYVELGRYNESIALVEDCANTIEKQFGCNSVELSRELMKLFDLLTLDLGRLMESGLQDSEEYRNKLKKMKSAMKQTKRIIEGTVDAAAFLNNIPGMTAALKNVEII